MKQFTLVHGINREWMKQFTLVHGISCDWTKQYTLVHGSFSAGPKYISKTITS